MKGQKSRAGARFQPLVRELIKRYHKLRGYRASSGSTIPSLSLSTLDKSFQALDSVTVPELIKRGLVRRGATQVKILSTGKLTKPLSLQGCKTSASAKAAIEKAGGSVQ